MEKKILITGGAGFIGSHVVRLFVNKYPGYKIVNLDALTYAGNLANLRDIESKPNYEFVKGDIRDPEFLQQLFSQHAFDGVIHLAAESHVDRSISSPLDFVMTNVIGTVNLLNAAKHLWQTPNLKPQTPNLFYHISTDEVYGTLGATGHLRKKPPTIRTAPTPLPKPAAIILSEHTTTRTNCLSSFPIVRTTTGRTIFLKS
jgi:dTDP-glucose 4,6-dehydratase